MMTVLSQRKDPNQNQKKIRDAQGKVWEGSQCEAACPHPLESCAVLSPPSYDGELAIVLPAREAHPSSWGPDSLFGFSHLWPAWLTISLQPLLNVLIPIVSSSSRGQSPYCKSLSTSKASRQTAALSGRTSQGPRDYFPRAEPKAWPLLTTQELWFMGFDKVDLLSLGCCGSLLAALWFWAANPALALGLVSSFVSELIDQVTSKITPSLELSIPAWKGEGREMLLWVEGSKFAAVDTGKAGCCFSQVLPAWMLSGQTELFPWRLVLLLRAAAIAGKTRNF